MREKVEDKTKSADNIFEGNGPLFGLLISTVTVRDTELQPIRGMEQQFKSTFIKNTNPVPIKVTDPAMICSNQEQLL